MGGGTFKEARVQRKKEGAYCKSVEVFQDDFRVIEKILSSLIGGGQRARRGTGTVRNLASKSTSKGRKRGRKKTAVGSGTKTRGGNMTSYLRSTKLNKRAELRNPWKEHRKIELMRGAGGREKGACT